MADTTNSPQVEQTFEQPKATQSEKTPPNTSNQPNPPGTPFAGNRAGMETHSSTDHDRQSNFESLRRDISGKIIGPMPTRDFLAKFIPSRAPTCVSPPSMVDLDEVKCAKQETEMYTPFIKAFKGCISADARFADSHSSPLSQWEGRIIAPDVVLLDNSLETSWIDRNPETSSTSFISRPIESVGIMLEFKFDDKTSDPFTDDKDATSFEIELKDPKDAKGQTLGQICAYATAHMANQFRSHVFSVLVFREYARILRWDRAGVVVTEKINFDPVNANLLAEFFHQYSCATPAQRGVDPFTERYDASPLSDEVKKQLDSTLKGPFYRFTFPGSGGVNNKFYIVAVPQFMGTASPTGRSTRSFKAYDMQKKTFVFIKDTWRIIAKSLVPEHKRYEALYKAEVKYIPTVSNHHDFTSQVTMTSLDLLPGAKRGNFPNTFRKFQHYQLVLDEYATPLEDFKDVKQLLTIVYEAMQAHTQAYDNAHILHRDVSAGNIMIGPDGHGLLIDWDFSKSTINTEQTSLPERTGTWQFIAYRLLRMPQTNGPIPIHDRDDDMESFWHVLFWVALRNCEHSADMMTILHILANAYDGSLGRTRASPVKEDLMISIKPKTDFSSPPLRQVIEEFRRCVKVRYIEDFQPAERMPFFRKNWQEVLAAHPDEDNHGVLAARLWSRVENEPGLPDQYSEALKAVIATLEPGWELRIFDKVLNPSAELTVDWITGSRKVRREGLETRTRSSLNKRKPNTQLTPVISGVSDGDDGGDPRNKKARKESELQSVHEERE